MTRAAGRYVISAMLLSVPSFVWATQTASLPWQQPGLLIEQPATEESAEDTSPPQPGTMPLPLPPSLVPQQPAADMLHTPESLQAISPSAGKPADSPAEQPATLTDMQPAATLPKDPAPSTETQAQNAQNAAPPPLQTAEPQPAYFNAIKPASGGLQSATTLDSQEEKALQVPANLNDLQPTALPPPQMPVANSDEPSPTQPTLPWQRVPANASNETAQAAPVEAVNAYAQQTAITPEAQAQPLLPVPVPQAALPVPATMPSPHRKPHPKTNEPSISAEVAKNGSPNISTAFHDMLVTVYQQNPKLIAARHEVKASDERVAEAVSGFRPTLNASGDIGRQREQTAGQSWIYGTARDESLVLNQPIFNGNGTFAQFHAARARVSAERAHLITVEEQVFLDAITAYLDAVTRQQILSLTQQNRAHLQGYVSATEKRLKAGDSTETDLAQAQTRLAQADTAVATAEANWIAADATFERNTGLRMMSTEFPLLPDGLPDTAEDAVTLARKAPEFTESAEQERAASHDIDAASSSLWPTVSLRASTSSDLTPSLGLENLRNDSVTLNVNIPLYEGGAEHARVREARELKEKAHEDMIDTARFMAERAKQAWHNYYAAYLVINASGKSADAAERALHGVEIEQQQGLRTMEDTLDSRSEYLNALIAKVQAEQSLHLQAYRLMAATGQLTATALHLEVPIYDPQKHYDRVADKWAGLK